MAVIGNPGSGSDQYSADDDHELGMQNSREVPIRWLTKILESLLSNCVLHRLPDVLIDFICRNRDLEKSRNN